MGLPSGPVVKTPYFHCRGPRFDPWLGNQDPACHVVQPKKNFFLIKKEKVRELTFNETCILCISHFILIIALQNSLHQLHFTGKETKAEGG